MSEFTKGELTLKKYRKLDAVYLGDKCIIKMAFLDYAEELVCRWNSQPDLLKACERVTLMFGCQRLKNAPKCKEGDMCCICFAEAAIAKATHKP